MLNHLGRYELLGLIASGGMGKVHLARVVGEGGFEREVALKVMHEHLLHEADFVAMFLDEARLAARIRHPNVVPTIDVQKTDTALFLVMDLVEGLSISAILKQLRRRERTLVSEELSWDTDSGRLVKQGKKQRMSVPMPLDVGARIIIDALNGLQAAHDLTDRQGQSLNLVHRDVSPGNVLVGKDGVSRITDFGVARAESRLTSTMGGQIKGKLPYMPPEQITADQVDARADVYAVGCVLWEVLVGRRLFHDEHQGALIRSVLKGDVRSPSQVNSAVPASVDQVCVRALASNPAERFASAADFAEALENAVRQAGQNVASTRQVATFVAQFRTNLSQMADARKSAPSMQSLQLTDPLGNLTPPSMSQQISRSFSGVTGSGSLPSYTQRSARVGALPGELPEPPQSVSSVMSQAESLPSAGSTRTAAVFSAADLEAASRRGKYVAFLGVLGGAAIAGAIAFVALGVGESEDTAAAAQAAQTTPALSSAPEPQPTASAVASAAPTAEPSVEPSAVAKADEPAKPRVRHRPARRRPAAKATPAAPAPQHSDQLPSEYLPDVL